MPKLAAQEIIQMEREYTFFSWSVQGQANTIPVDKAEGIYFWHADGKRYIDFSSQLMKGLAIVEKALEVTDKVVQ